MALTATKYIRTLTPMPAGTATIAGTQALDEDNDAIAVTGSYEITGLAGVPSSDVGNYEFIHFATGEDVFESDGVTVTDHSGNGNHATASNSYCRALNGVNEYITYPNLDIGSSAEKIKIEWRCNYTLGTNARYVVASYDYEVGQRSFAILMDLGRPKLFLSDDGTSDSGHLVTWIATTDYSDGAEHSFSIEYDCSDNSITALVDGATMAGSFTLNPSITSIHQGTRPLRIGATSNTTTLTPHYQGDVWDVRVTVDDTLLFHAPLAGDLDDVVDDLTGTATGGSYSRQDSYHYNLETAGGLTSAVESTVTLHDGERYSYNRALRAGMTESSTGIDWVYDRPANHYPIYPDTITADTGTTYTVTDAGDDGSAGQLRTLLEATDGPAQIAFSSGIHPVLNGPIYCYRKHKITIQGNPTTITGEFEFNECSNIVIRDCRVYSVDQIISTIGRSVATFRHCRNVLLDQCTFAFGNDSCLAFSECLNAVVDDCIMTGSAGEHTDAPSGPFFAGKEDNTLSRSDLSQYRVYIRRCLMANFYYRIMAKFGAFYFADNWIYNFTLRNFISNAGYTNADLSTVDLLNNIYKEGPNSGSTAANELEGINCNGSTNLAHVYQRGNTYETYAGATSEPITTTCTVEDNPAFTDIGLPAQSPGVAPSQPGSSSPDAFEADLWTKYGAKTSRHLSYTSGTIVNSMVAHSSGGTGTPFGNTVGTPLGPVMIFHGEQSLVSSTIVPFTLRLVSDSTMNTAPGGGTTFDLEVFDADGVSRHSVTGLAIGATASGSEFPDLDFTSGGNIHVQTSAISGIDTSYVKLVVDIDDGTNPVVSVSAVWDTRSS